MALRVGHINYLNCVPFFNDLGRCGFNGTIMSGVPSDLNARLAAGDIDLSISSSFEYAQNWRDYLLLAGQSISSCGPVGSVLLFSALEPEQLDGEEIFITGESATSIHLLKVLLLEFFGCRTLHCRVPDSPVEERIAAGRPALLIGDRAMRVKPPTPLKTYDLGELWQQTTGLPFVFALWILRQETALRQPQAVKCFADQLGKARQAAMSRLEDLAAQRPEQAWLGTEGLVGYWQQISYDLTPKHLEGLRLFYHYCRKYGLLDENPELRFFRAPGM